MPELGIEIDVGGWHMPLMKHALKR